MKDKMRPEYDFSKGVRGKHAKDMLAGYTVQVTGQVTGQATVQATDQATDHATDHATGQATGQVSGQVSGQVTGQVTGQVSEEVRRLMLILKGEMKRAEMQEKLGLKHREFFNNNYLQPAIDIGLLELVFPQIPFHPKQAYRLSEKGKALKRSLKAKDKKS